MWLFLLFIVVPILEIALFIQVGGAIGLWPTLGLVVLTALAGTLLVRTQGLATLRRLQAAAGQDPVGPLAHGAIILVAGILLLTPGFFTDAVALALLVPAVRTALIRWGAARMTVIAAAELRRERPPPPGRGPQTVEADYEVIDEQSPEEARRSSRDAQAQEDGPAAAPPERQGRSAWTRPPR